MPIDIIDFFKKIKLKIKFQKSIETINVVLKLFFFYLAFIGIFGFSLFILEEITQVNCWAIFAASDANRYDLIKKNCDIISQTNESAKWINKYFMWINPFQYLAYKAYADGIDVYIETQQAFILANDPSVYIGEYVTLQFKYNTYKPAKNGLFAAVNNKIKIILQESPKQKTIQVSGIVRPDPDRLGGVIITNILGDTSEGGKGRAATKTRGTN